MRLEPCRKLLGCWDSGGVGVATPASGVTLPCDDGRISCGSEGSSISALGLCGFVGVWVTDGEETAN